jgi:hypothetical protein
MTTVYFLVDFLNAYYSIEVLIALHINNVTALNFPADFLYAFNSIDVLTTLHD